MDIYQVTIRKEILREVVASIISDLLRYFDKKNIDVSDESNPVIILLYKLYDLGESLLSDTYCSMNSLNEISSKLNFINEYVGALSNE